MSVTISASDVNKLRQQTGAGMMDCRKALAESDGDFEKAIDWLRKQGQKVAAKREDREAKEGVVIAKTSADNKTGVIVNLSSETDFVAKNQDFIDFVMIEDELNEFLSSLMPTNATLRRLLLGRYMPLFDEDQDIVEDLLLNNEQSIEACNSNLKSIDNIREAYSSISSHNLNSTMKVLTVATVLIALPNVFYGMYGMNVPLPFQEEPWAYFMIVGFTLFMIVFIFWFARKRKLF